MIDLDKMNCEGSHIIIEPHGNDFGLLKGIVYITNTTKNVYKGDVVLYHKDDIRVINVSVDKVYHLIKYYEIIIKSKTVESKNYKFRDMEF